MRAFQLGMHALPANDERLIRNLMRMFAHDPSFNWQLGDGPHYDVLVIDAQKMEDTRIKRTSRTVLRLSDVAVPEDDHVLPRPLQAQALRRWLMEAEWALEQATRPPSTLAPLESLPENTPIAEPRSVRFRLRTWPPAIMMAGDPTREQMAQLLFKDAISVAELSRITGAPRTECQAFVRKLQLVGLVDLVSAGSKREKTATPAVDEDFGNPVASRDGLGSTIGRLRNRLGL